MNKEQEEYLARTVAGCIPNTHPDFERLQGNVKKCVEQIVKGSVEDTAKEFKALRVQVANLDKGVQSTAQKNGDLRKGARAVLDWNYNFFDAEYNDDKAHVIATVPEIAKLEELLK